MKVHGIILAVVQFFTKLGQLRLQILLSYFQPFLHLAAAVAHGGFFQHFKASLHVVKLFGEYLYHGFLGLRYLGKLVVCQDDAIPVVVLDFGKHLFAVGRCEVFLARVQDFCVRVCLAERVGNFVYIRFQADNQRLLYQSQTLHFIGRDAHNHGLACAYFVPADTAAKLLNHPDLQSMGVK